MANKLHVFTSDRLFLKSVKLIGLSKERPILGHHAKAHILKSGGFHLKSGGFHVKSKDHLQGIVTLCFRFVRF